MDGPILPKNAGPVDWVGPKDYSYAISGLTHCYRLPEDADDDHPVPAIVMVHGRGGDESVMWIFKQVVPQNVAVFTPRAPLELEEGGYSWFDHAGQRLNPDLDSLKEGMKMLTQFLTSLPKLYPVNAEKTILIGFSQGAALGNGLILSNPELVSGLASLSGSMPPSPNGAEPVGDLAGLPVFVAHGTRDDIAPLREGRRTRDIYRELGANVTYGEYAVGHKMNPEGMSDLKQWVAEVLNST